ncbi:MAG: hypothetical protein M4579_002060 [Chaenotheca gracillima]|nr:MAG: hypothetical protein M4579_002060 [Chaenotheca gracillima]
MRGTPVLRPFSRPRLCVFCATHLPNDSRIAFRPLPIRSRGLHSTSSTSGSQGAGAALKEDDDSTSSQPDRVQKNSDWGRGFEKEASNSFEERESAAVRSRLRSARTQPDQRSSFAPSRTLRIRRGSDDLNESTREQTPSRLDSSRTTSPAAGKRFDGRVQTPRDITSGWNHFRSQERSSAQDQRPRNESRSGSRGLFEANRREREEKARRGTFVQFDSQNNTDHRGSPSRGDGRTSRVISRESARPKAPSYSERSLNLNFSGVESPIAANESIDASVQVTEAEEAKTPSQKRDEEIKIEKQRRRAEKFALDSAYDQTAGMKGREKTRKTKTSRLKADEDEEDSAVSRAIRKRKRKEEKAAQKADAPPTPVSIPEFISVEHLARLMKVKPAQFAQKLESLGFENTGYDHIINAETAGLIAMEYNIEPIPERIEGQDLVARPETADKSVLPQRPPVVTIMGHVDHGKTTLLDWLRKSSVAAGEHGGITQHIGAFSVPMPSGKIITFLDTPGHAAFLSMRQRGANVTDIVILVVAADDSVKPQTIEAIKHAQAAKVPMIVAINKIDKPESDIQRVKQDLARHGVEVEDFGGDTQTVCVSGKTGQGMQELEEAAVALSEIIDMRAEQDGSGEGWVLEATTKKGGRVATVLVRRGTLRAGDIIVAGSTWARIRTLKNEAGVEIPAAGPGTPVEVDGWREQPAAGDEVLQAPDESKAKSVVEYRSVRAERLKMAADVEAVNVSRRLEHEKREQEEATAKQAKQAKLDGGVQDQKEPAVVISTPKENGPKEVYFIVKADVSGSVEAVLNSIAALGSAEVTPRVLRSGVGPIGEFDVEHAAAAKGHLINFNTPIEPTVARMAQAGGVQIIDENIIYRLMDTIKAKMSEYLAPSVTRRVLGEAEVAQVFDITVKGRATKPVAGCRVRNGVINRNAKIRVLRGPDEEGDDNKEVLYEGTLSSLRIVKKDVTETRKGNECGIGFGNDWTAFRVGDKVQAYEEVVKKRYL